MSWQDQGRQEHGWFGHGTGPVQPEDPSDGGIFGPDGLAQRILAVAHGAVGALPQALRARAAAQYDAGNLGRLTEVMTAWIRGTKLGVDEFAERFFGGAADDPGIEQLHSAALGVGLARSHAELREASGQLADAIQAIGLDRWPRLLADAQERARDPVTVAAVEKSRQRRNGETTQTPPDAGGKGGGGNGPGPVGSAVRSVFGHVDPDQWAARGAAAGGAAGALVGGAVGGAGEGAIGAAGGSMALPGGGTIVGGIAGAVAGAAKRAAVGGAAGAIVGGTIGKVAGELITYMEGNESDRGASGEAKADPKAAKPYRDNPDQLKGRPAAEVEKELDQKLVQEGRWTKSPSADGNGVRYIDHKGNSVIINRGYPGGLRSGGGDKLHQYPYVKIQPGGIRVPLAGNPAAGE